MKIKAVNGMMLFLRPGEMDKAAKWYEDVFGAKICGEMSHGPAMGFRAQGAWLGLNTNAPYRLELSEYIEGSDFPFSKQMERTAPCFNDFGIEVEDIDEAIAELRAKGVIVSDKLRIINPMFAEEIWECIIHPKSAFGTLIELYEVKGKRAPDGEW